MSRKLIIAGLLAAVAVAGLLLRAGRPAPSVAPAPAGAGNSSYDVSIPLVLTQSGLAALAGQVPGDSRFDDFVAQFEERWAPEAGLSGASPAPSCAVVGNGPAVLGKRYGPAIDGHTLVFRMNNGPVAGFETDVGSRTTHHVQHVRIPLMDDYPDHPLQVIADYDFISEGTRTGFERLVTLAGLLRAQGRVVLLHPDFMTYVRDRWFPFKDPTQKDPLPSIGLLTAVLALHLCQSVDLYGFGRPNESGVWEHYWKLGASRPAVPAIHAADRQQDYLEELAAQKVLTIAP